MQKNLHHVRLDMHCSRQKKVATMTVESGKIHMRRKDSKGKKSGRVWNGGKRQEEIRMTMILSCWSHKNRNVYVMTFSTEKMSIKGGKREIQVGVMRDGGKGGKEIVPRRSYRAVPTKKEKWMR